MGALPLALLALGGRAGAADPVDGPAVGEGENPGQGGAPAGVEPRGGAPEFEQHLLGHLLRLGRVPHHTAHEPEHGPGHLSVQLLECLLVASGHEHQKFVRLHSSPSPAARGLSLRLHVRSASSLGWVTDQDGQKTGRLPKSDERSVRAP